MTTKAPAAGRTKEKAQELGRQYVCLGCEKKVDPAEEQYRRGLCEACYSEVDRLKNKGRLTYDELVEAGLMLPGKRGGRPRSADRRPSAFSAFLAVKDGATESLAVAAQLLKTVDEEGRPKPPKGRKKKGK